MFSSLTFSMGAIAVLLLVSAFFSGSETALTAVSRARMHRLEKVGSRTAAIVNSLVLDRERLIGAMLLGNTFVNILISSLATEMFEARYGHQAVAIVTLVMTLIVLIFAEVLPKTLAIARTDRFALAVARPVRLVVPLLAPVVSSVQFIVWRVLALFGVRADEAEPLMPAHDEIRGAVELHHQEGTVEREHRDMISGVLDLKDLTVADVMIHRKNMIGVDANMLPRELIEAVLDTNHTRVPMWRNEPENIVGVLHTKDLVREIARRSSPVDGIDVLSLAAPPWFVPETTTLQEQLAAFRERRTHFALVVDEYGALQGLVTLEDILDEIFGDIPDEHEAREAPGIRRQPDGTFNIDGDVPVREINRALDWNLPEDAATTLAGLVIDEARAIPEVGQRFAFFGFKFEILRRQRNQITAIRVAPPLRTAAPAAEAVRSD